MDEKDVIKQAQKNKRRAQTLLYETYKTVWYRICLRYNRDVNDAADVLQNALVKIFTKISQFDIAKGSFKSWSSKIVVNENLMHLRKSGVSFVTDELDSGYQLADGSESPLESLSRKELTKMISGLPEGYRTVFNLYVLDGYNHREIGEMLHISEGTSKSQLFKAKKILQQKLEVLI
ncbi:MAG: RNA polymerase sigma factor (sigma-70 family) [Bacteroidia bacterium]|jgi:RNA polymerase sigma factor (sigma-70 family)